jgi:NADPH:quinone reductase-like Zn-dependent oxidoreductase
MRQVWITKAGPPEVLQVREASDPSAKAGEVRIRVKAAGINFADLMARVGLYPDAPKVPCVVGYEVSGVVDQVGAGVTDFVIGDRVIAMPHFGGYTDVLALPVAQVFRMPEKMSFEEGAALPVVYLTAHHMMLWTGVLRDGMRIFIHSAAGGVGLAAIELAQTKKTVIFGTASPGKHEFLRQKGVQYPIDSSADYSPVVREALKREKCDGLDLVLDPVGGESWSKGYELLGPAGRLVAFGLSAAASGKQRSLVHAALQILKVRKYGPMKLMDENKTVSGCNMGHLFSRLDLLVPQFRSLIGLYEDGKIHPRVDKTFPFDEAPAAHHYIHDRKAMGKVLLVP